MTVRRHPILLRSATEADAPALLAIYAPYVEQTNVSFETTVPDTDEFAARIRRYGDGWAWLVAEREGQLLGYAYGSPHRAVGFEPVGVFHAAGRKFGAWRDIAWYERRLRAEPPEE